MALLSMTSLSVTLALTFGEVFSIVVGVVLALAGLALLLMGLIAMTEKAVKQGAITSGISLLVLALGLWLIGLFG